MGWLFLGRPGPPCVRGADANDSGKVDLSDAVFSLGCLFLGQACPPPPHPGCGPDPTADPLACRSSPCP
ncbi:MAG: hypothetical protein HY721_15475 [Planctomycetes bacterium]|nr:hypothetical protein [Planctomycetota bacterium]